MFFLDLRKILRCLRDLYIESDCKLSPDEIERLSNHRYSASSSSWLDQSCMKRFWDLVVRMYPLWLAPNTITMIGFLINLITVLILSFFCYTSKETAPSWAYYLAAVGLFVYQTLDGTDGKQARRTNSASPLGELFDHGCDSLSQVFITLNVCHAMQLGDTPYLVFGMTMGGIIVFYCAHWSTYCIGELRFSKFDLTEAEMTIILVLVTTGYFGPQIWNTSIFGIKLKILIMLISLLLTLRQIDGYLMAIFHEGAGRNGSTIANTSVLSPLFPIVTVCALFSWIYFESASDIFDRNSTLFALYMGAIASKITNRLIIAHMSKSPLKMIDTIYAAPLLIVINRFYGWNVNELIILILSAMYAYANLLLFCWMICDQFCRSLGIAVFSITKTRHCKKTRTT